MYSKTLTAFAAAVLVAVPATADAQVHRTQLHDYQLTTVARDLNNPWSMAWLPNGDMLITERPGRLRIVRDGVLLDDLVDNVPEVLAQGQGGLFDVVLHPDYTENGYIYLSYAKPYTDGTEGAHTAVIRARLEDDALVGIEPIWEAQSVGRGHYGGRMAFDADGYLYVTAGDRQAPSSGDLEAHPAQDYTNHHGVIVRLHDDGRIPADNPFIGVDGPLADIYSYGHRNPQGLVIDPWTGDIWSTEHGPQGGDELNLIEAGKNYGWPVIGYGVNYGEGTPIHSAVSREGMERPVHWWVPSIGTSGLMMYTGNRFPAWRGDLFAGGLSGEVVYRLEMDGQNVVQRENVFRDMGRVRDVRQGPDGFIYVAIEDRRGGNTDVVRMEPAGGR